MNSQMQKETKSDKHKKPFAEQIRMYRALEHQPYIDYPPAIVNLFAETKAFITKKGLWKEWKEMILQKNELAVEWIDKVGEERDE
jgi:hypothetical protein